MMRSPCHAVVVLLAFVGATFPARAQYPDPAKRDHPRSSVLCRRLERHPVACDWPEAQRRLATSGDRRQPVGASGSVGAGRVARGMPDGYTLLIVSSTYTINSAVAANLP